MRRPQFRLQFLVMSVGVAFAIWRTWGAPWTTLRIVGAAIMLVGTVLWIAALRELGDAFTWKAQATQLVTTGLYAKIRNPIYMFRGVAIAGWFLFLGVPRWLLLGVIAIPIQWMRARREAAVLEHEFGDRYREYRRHVWF